MIVKYEIGDEVHHKLHKQKAIVLWVHPDREKVVVEHTSSDRYIAVVDYTDIEPTSNHKYNHDGEEIEENEREVVEMTVEEISNQLGKTVKVVE